MTEADFEQTAFGQGGFFTSGDRSGRTSDQKTSRRFYRRHDLRSRRQQEIAEAPPYEHSGTVELVLPDKPYMAVRMQTVETGHKSKANGEKK